jgi:hypothetical protein
LSGLFLAALAESPALEILNWYGAPPKQELVQCLRVSLSLQELILIAEPMFRGGDNFVAFFEEFAMYASQIRLRRLSVGLLYPQLAKALCKLLPRLVFLESIHIEWHYRVDLSTLVAALSRNGSLLSFTISNPLPRQSLPGSERFTERNRNMAPMLSDDQVSIFLYPRLFHIAKEAPRLAPNSLFRVLLTSRDRIPRPHPRSKRRRGVLPG